MRIYNLSPTPWLKLSILTGSKSAGTVWCDNFYNGSIKDAVNTIWEMQIIATGDTTTHSKECLNNEIAGNTKYWWGGVAYRTLLHHQY